MKVREMSRCPHCRALGVKLFEPLIQDGFNVDRPYCGKCGRNWPVEREAEDEAQPPAPTRFVR